MKEQTKRLSGWCSLASCAPSVPLEKQGTGGSCCRRSRESSGDGIFPRENSPLTRGVCDADRSLLSGRAGSAPPSVSPAQRRPYISGRRGAGALVPAPFRCAALSI